MGVARPPIVEKARALFTISNTENINAGNVADNKDLQRMSSEKNAPTEQEKSVLDQFAK